MSQHRAVQKSVRTRLVRFTAAVALLACGLAVVPGTALAAPGAKPAAGARDEQPATFDERLRAAEAAGLGDDAWRLARLEDKPFLVELWRAPVGPEVRAAVELAMQVDSPGEFGRVIRTGVREAAARDKAQAGDTRVTRVDRDDRRRATALLGVVATPELLRLNTRDFLLALWQRTTGAETRKALLTAAHGGHEEWRTFFDGAMWQAVFADQDTAREALPEAERPARLEREARLRAAAVFGAVAFPALLEHHDWSYLSILLTKAAPGGPLAIELRRTLDSNDPAVLRKFLAEGIHLARTEETKRDQAQIGDDLRIAILRRIERTRTTGMNPALYAAGQKALDGSQADLRRFVETGQFTVLRQSFQVTTPGLPGTLFVRHAQGLGAISPVDGSSSELDKQDSTFVVKPGLADKDCYSLESANIPGAYLRHQSFRIKLADQDGSQVFAEDATFCAAKTQTGSRLESLNMKGRYLRHFRGEIWLADTSGAHEFDSGHMFTEDTTWKVTDPWAPQPR